MPPLWLNCTFFPVVGKLCGCENLCRFSLFFFWAPHLLISYQGAANKTTVISLLMCSMILAYLWLLHQSPNEEGITRHKKKKLEKSRVLHSHLMRDVKRQSVLVPKETQRGSNFTGWTPFKASTRLKAADEIWSCALNLAAFQTHLPHTGTVSLSQWDNKHSKFPAQ